MKKVILGLMISLVFVPLAFAARVKVRNEANCDLSVSVHYGKNDEMQNATVPNENEHTFNSGVHGFNEICWKELRGMIEVCYRALVPSTGTMLKGLITIREQGRYSINFDDRGSSDKKYRELDGQACSKSPKQYR